MVKGYVAKNNRKFTLKEIETLVPEGIRRVTPALWKKFVGHTEKIEDEYWKRDGLIEDVVEEIMIKVGDDGDDESSDEELEPDEDDLRYNETGPAQTPAGEKPCCSRQLLSEHTELPDTFLNSVLPLNLLD